MWTIQALNTWVPPAWLVAYYELRLYEASPLSPEWVSWHWKKALKADPNCGENECMSICKCWGIVLDWIEKSHYIVLNMIMNERINWVSCKLLIMTSYEWKCIWFLNSWIHALILKSQQSFFHLIFLSIPSFLSRALIAKLFFCSTWSSLLGHQSLSTVIFQLTELPAYPPSKHWGVCCLIHSKTSQRVGFAAFPFNELLI